MLLAGARLAKRPPPDELHPLGYGRETFFWSFMVAIFLFSLGGLFAVYEGWTKLSNPTPLHQPWLGLIIFMVGMIFEGFALRVCINEIRVQYPKGNLFKWFKKSVSSDLLVLFTEDSAALLGLTIASICIVTAWIIGDSSWDAYGSIAIGVILIVVAGFLASEIKSLLLGEVASGDFKTPLLKPTVKYIAAWREPAQTYCDTDRF